MIWWLVGIIVIGCSIEHFILRGHVTLGRWAFTTREDGSFSMIQKVAQVSLLIVLSLGAMLALWGLIRSAK